MLMTSRGNLLDVLAPDTRAGELGGGDIGNLIGADAEAANG
jgi:hypothetical protein